MATDKTALPPPEGTKPSCESCLLIGMVAMITIIVGILVNLNFTVAANYCFAALIGVATGGTELMSRFRDRPLAVVVSAPGLFYMAINGAASVLALYLMIVWGWIEEDWVKRVLVAGLAAMGVFRAGMFTTKVDGREVAFGPNMVLKVVLDVLDREYDRTAAFRRAGIIAKAMDGIDFKQAKSSLKELCLSLMQNVTGNERKAVDDEIDRLVELGETTLGEAKAMALGLSLIGIVGEDTLQAATTNLGSSIFGFSDLSEDLSNLLLKRTPEDVLANLYRLCNQLAHARLRQKPEKIDQALAEIDAMHLPTLVSSRVLAIRARQSFGDSVLKAALEMLPPRPETVPAAPAAPPTTPAVPASGGTPSAPTGTVAALPATGGARTRPRSRRTGGGT